jgi:hypothetical protein
VETALQEILRLRQQADIKLRLLEDCGDHIRELQDVDRYENAMELRESHQAIERALGHMRDIDAELDVLHSKIREQTARLDPQDLAYL